MSTPKRGILVQQNVGSGGSATALQPARKRKHVIFNPDELAEESSDSMDVTTSVVCYALSSSLLYFVKADVLPHFRVNPTVALPNITRD